MEPDGGEFVERLQASYLRMTENSAEFEEIAPIRRRSVGGKTLTIRNIS
jgi:hypothetical protein